jgi:hypothetical protein
VQDISCLDFSDNHLITSTVFFINGRNCGGAKCHNTLRRDIKTEKKPRTGGHFRFN